MPGSQSPSPLRNVEKVLDDAQHTGELILTGRKLKCFPKNSVKYDLVDTNKAELSRNQFSEVPEEVCEFFSLEHLNLSHNLVRFLPELLTNLQELVELNISHNLLLMFPSFLCQLRHLQVLSLNGNKITSIPEEIGQLSKLTSLDISCNELTQLPNQLGDLSSLKDLNLRRNQLIELPICLSRLKLFRLDISCNKIAHIPCDFRKVTSLEEIHVEGNPLVSPPAHLCLRGLVHIMKFLHKEATKHEHRVGLSSAGSIQRRLKRSSSFSTTSDGRLVGFDRNRSYHLGHGLSLLGRNTSVDRSSVHRNEQTKSDGANTAENSAQSVSSVRLHVHDACTAIESISSSLLGLNRSRQTSSQVQLAAAPNPSSSSSVSMGGNSNAISVSSNKTSFANKTISTSDTLNNNNKSNSNDLSNSKSLSTQAQTASQQLEMWLNGLNIKSLSITRNETNKNMDSPDAITKELLRQKAESEAKKKRIESLKSRLVAAKTEFERNEILHQYSLNQKADTGLVSNVAIEKVSSVHIASTIPSSSSSAQPINSCSNSNTLPRCGPTKESLEQTFSKQKVKLPISKISTFRKASDDGEMVKNNSTVSKEVKQTKNSTIRSNGTNSEPKNGSITKQEASANGLKSSNATEKDKAQIEKMRKSIETMLKISLPPENLESSLKDGVILCHLVNHIRPRAVSCIHVSSPSAPTLSAPKIRRNVDNFLLACRRIGVDQNNICLASAIVEDFNAVSLAITVNALVSNNSRPA